MKLGGTTLKFHLNLILLLLWECYIPSLPNLKICSYGSDIFPIYLTKSLSFMMAILSVTYPHGNDIT